ncbi:dihydrofolate reductase [Cellvibrio sp. pealriver]|uniref:dihydrofolate reductase n=1 Tax=Cellvibrio sp. pealriver TaxID=1622269 RepID=UPI00066FCA70|nr:dihydrofolate reductase [Cellvibrio sp. pealriver]
MKLAIIVAVAKNGVIGRNNQLPWHLPQDLKYFKSVTLGKPVIMGRKTYESIGRPLPGRFNIVITRNPEWVAEGVKVAHSFGEAVQVANGLGTSEAMIIGGAEIYKAALSVVQRIYLTRVDLEPDGDAFFAEPDSSIWSLISSVDGEADASPGYTFLTYDRLDEYAGDK